MADEAVENMPAKKFTIVCRGIDEHEIELAFDEAVRRIKDGNIAGHDSNEDGAFFFDVSDDVPEAEQPALEKNGLNGPHNAYEDDGIHGPGKAWGVKDKYGALVYEPMFYRGTAKRLAELCDQHPSLDWEGCAEILEKEGYFLDDPCGPKS